MIMSLVSESVRETSLSRCIDRWNDARCAAAICCSACCIAIRSCRMRRLSAWYAMCQRGFIRIDFTDAMHARVSGSRCPRSARNANSDSTTQWTCSSASRPTPVSVVSDDTTQKRSSSMSRPSSV